MKKKEEEISTWKQSWEDEKTEKEFYHKSAQESKRKHKIVKLALSRLQLEYDKMKAQYLTATEDLKFSTNLQKKCVEVLGPIEEDSTMFVTKVDQDKLDKFNRETRPWLGLQALLPTIETSDDTLRGTDLNKPFGRGLWKIRTEFRDREYKGQPATGKIKAIDVSFQVPFSLFFLIK